MIRRAAGLPWAAAVSRPPASRRRPARAGLLAPLAAALALLALLVAAAAPAAPRVPPPVLYRAAQLDCSRYRQQTESGIETGVAGRVRRETAGLAGLWVVRAREASPDSILLEAWWDTLSVWRRSGDTTLRPDTDGILGGRYRGVLTPDGLYAPAARPFVPDEVAEVIDLSSAAEDLLPRLPPVPLDVGRSWWAPDSSLEIRRLDDSLAGERLARFREIAHRTAGQARLRGDTTPLEVRQTTMADGVFVWSERDGLVRRDRRIVVETDIPARGRVRRPVRSRLEQRVVLERAGSGCPAE